MQIGYFAIGFGLSADPDLIALTARSTEQCGFHSLWVPEHIVFLKEFASQYPYAPGVKSPILSTKGSSSNVR